MNLFAFAARSFSASRRTAVPLILLGALTTAAVTGAVLAGDFVRGTLSAVARERLGRAEYVLDSPSRFISVHIMDALSISVPDADVVPCILTSGSVSSGDLRVSGVQVVGVDEGFFRMSPGATGEGAPHPAAAYVNERLAAALSLEVGGGILLSVSKAGAMPLDAPLSGSDPGAAILSLSVQAVLDEAHWGRFSLRSEQRSPFTVIVDRDRLARAMGRAGMANLVLAAPKVGAGSAPSRETLDSALADAWDIRFAGFSIGTYGRYAVLESERVFIEQAASEAIDRSKIGGEAVLGYFLDSITAKAAGVSGASAASPYAFAAGLDIELLSGIRITAPPRPSDRGSGGVTVTNWLSEDLGVGVGDSITLSYRVPSGDGLAARSAVERIDAVVNVPVSAEARALMPGFPGMSTAETCAQWDPGIPLDLSRIRKKDEQYWYTYQGTPKVFLSPEEGRRLWANEYGDRTAYFFHNTDPDELAGNLSLILNPKSLGVAFRDASTYGLSARAGPLDFGALFLGLSLFLIASSLLLTGLVFSLHIEGKDRETGLLLAVGIMKPRIAVIRLLEGGMAAALSSVAGCILGIAYSLLVARALNGIWSAAVSGGDIRIVLRLSSLAFPALSGFAASMAAMSAALAQRFPRSVVSLLTGAAGHDAEPRKRRRRFSAAWVFQRRLLSVPRRLLARAHRLLNASRRPWAPPAACAGALAVATIVLAAFPGIMGSAAMGFFASGAAALGCILIAETILLSFLERTPRADTTLKLAVRNAAFKRRRTIASSVVIACGLFVIASVGANPWLVKPGAGGKSSGSGGFQYYVRTSRPFKPEDIRFRLGAGLEMVTAKLREGDDASCLNLARSIQPPIVGAPAAALSGRFSFGSIAPGLDRKDPWAILELEPPEGGLYAFADSLSLEWNLGLSVGDSIPVSDEFGRPLRLVIAGSLEPCVFQGSMVISEAAFRRYFPSVSGKSIALIERTSRPASDEEIAAAFRSYGAEVEGTGERLESFARVQYAYLSIFLFLGAAGLLFGMAGFAVMTARNIRENAAGRALLRAFGFVQPKLVLLSVGEQAVSLFGGLFAGAAASTIALLPLARSGGFPAAALITICAGAALMGLAWSAAASIRVPEPERRALIDLT